MRITASILAAAVLAGLAAGPAAAQDKKKRQADAPAGLFSPEVVRAVPGINALFRLTSEQEEKVAALRKEILEAEKVAEARKTQKDKAASKADKKAARDVVAEAEAALAAKVAELLGEEKGALVKKINAAARDAQAQVQEESRQRIKDTKGNKEERKKVQQEIEGKTTALIAEKVAALLSPEQKEALKKAAESGSKGKGEKKGKKKKEEPKEAS